MHLHEPCKQHPISSTCTAGGRTAGRVKERGGSGLGGGGGGGGGWHSHMSQQHAVVSQMSRLVSLRTPSRGDGVAAPPRRATCTHAPSSRKHALALNPRKGVMCMPRADRAGSSATTALCQGGAQRRGGPFFARGLPSVGSQRRHKEAPAGGQHPQKGVHHRPGEDGAHGTARRATVRLKAWRANSAAGHAHPRRSRCGNGG